MDARRQTERAVKTLKNRSAVGTSRKRTRPRRGNAGKVPHDVNAKNRNSRSRTSGARLYADQQSRKRGAGGRADGSRTAERESAKARSCSIIEIPAIQPRAGENKAIPSRAHKRALKSINLRRTCPRRGSFCPSAERDPRPADFLNTCEVGALTGAPARLTLRTIR